MVKNKRFLVTFGLTVFGLGFVAGNVTQFASVAEAQSGQVFELRTYTAHPGRLDALHARFRDHTTRIFEKHGITNIGYFSPQDSPLSDNTLIYLLAHDSRDAGEASWKAFRADPEWTSAAEESQRDGRIVEKVERVWMNATDYSKMK